MKAAPEAGGLVTAASPRSVLQPWIAARLHPLDGVDEQDGCFDVDRTVEDAPLAGPEMVYAPAAVLVGLVERDEGLNLILTRRAETLKRHTGQVALPGGRIEAGETPSQAALREAHEEIGLEPRFVHPVAQGDLYCTFTGFQITPVVAFVAPGFTLTPAIEEVAEVFETPFTFVMDPQSYEERTWEGPNGARRYFAMTHGERLIWGATAGILHGLWWRLFQAEAVSLRSRRPVAADH